MAETIRFRALLDSDEDSHGVFIQMPFSAQERFGSRGRVPVRGTINGFPFRFTLAPYGGVHYLPVNRALREAAGVEPGDTVEVALQRDDEPRVAAIPPDLADALAANPDAQAAWDRLSYTHRKEYAQAAGRCEEAGDAGAQACAESGTNDGQEELKEEPKLN